MKKRIVGTPYNISIKGDKALAGWYLVLSSDGDEFLVERSIAITMKKKFRLYKANQSFKNAIHTTIDQKKRNLGLGISISLVISALLRRILPLSIFFGDVNIPTYFSKGLMNIGEMVLFVGVWIICGILYRRYSFLNYCKKEGIIVERVGSIRNLAPLMIQKNGIGWW
ncbi:hypothetical protein [Streptococcus loxodontisalivarius]|uniref:Uncharacterized protein n=1 Tax=Streptococcus loxodontisalivarius TaxID=1349415 RepID=A0ABS2PUQ8_9STRE|nr:hypothetical protein [Streptococcus loxodontisalivarius]MBM7643745.1 hypothetical protein [Streptococcus loxodontisalivarius]